MKKHFYFNSLSRYSIFEVWQNALAYEEWQKCVIFIFSFMYHQLRAKILQTSKTFVGTAHLKKITFFVIDCYWRIYQLDMDKYPYILLCTPCIAIAYFFVRGRITPTINKKAHTKLKAHVDFVFQFHNVTNTYLISFTRVSYSTNLLLM